MHADGARPYVETLFTFHTPYAGEISADREPSEYEIIRALIRRRRPKVTEKDFQKLLATPNRGYGWLRPERVKQKLLTITAQGTGPPPPK